MLFVLLALLPYACLGGTIQLCAARGQRGGTPFFTSVIDAALLWSAVVWLGTNLGSFCGLLYSPWFIAVWLIYAIVLGYFIFHERSRFSFPGSRGVIPVSIATIAACAFLAAIFYPPNIWDVHSYHLPRVMHWLQNHSLAPYPTNIARQIGMPPFNSMIALQSLGMGAGDYFVNLGQWFAYLGMIAGVWRIASQLDDSRQTRLLAILFIATLPNAVIHASNTESSNIVSFWLLACAALELEWLKTRAPKTLLKFGLCLGFAILSKGSAYVIGLPFALSTAWFCLRRAALRQGLIAALCVIAINAPHYARVYEAYGSIVGGAESNILYRPTPGTFVSNAMYNFFLHVPWMIKEPLRPAWQGIARRLGADEEKNREIFPWGGLENAVSEFELGDSSTPNPLHALILLAMAAYIALGRFRPPLFYSCQLGGCFCLFFLLLTWHPWAARIQTPLFALAAPLAGSWINGLNRAKWRNLLIIMLLAWTFLVFQGGYRRLGFIDDNDKNFLYTSRSYLYFNNYKRHAQAYLDMVNFLAAHRPESIGLEVYDDAFEYPLWALLSQKVKQMPQIFHLTGPEDRAARKPRFIIVMNRGANKDNMVMAPPHILELSGGQYRKVFPAE